MLIVIVVYLTLDIQCGELPLIPNGTAVRVEGSLHTATVICDLWYQTRKSEIMCTKAGNWENATCAGTSKSVFLFFSEPLFPLNHHHVKFQNFQSGQFNF